MTTATNSQSFTTVSSQILANSALFCKSEGTYSFSVVLNAFSFWYRYKFESETDTEAVAVLTKYIWDTHQDKKPTFTNLIKAVLKELQVRI